MSQDILVMYLFMDDGIMIPSISNYIYIKELKFSQILKRDK